MKNNLLIALGFIAAIICSWLLASGIKRTPAGEYIHVTGMAEVSFESDRIDWTGDYSRTSINSMKEAYQLLKADQETVKSWFKSRGVHDSEMIFSTIRVDKVFDSDYSSGHYRSIFKGYKASQDIRLKSGRLDVIENVARESMELIEKGIEFNSGTPAFTYTKLSTLKLNLIDKAAADARSRAEKIAEATKSGLRQMKKATLGVFQITGEGENEEYSWGGVFNTTSRRKSARVTVSAGFSTN